MLRIHFTGEDLARIRIAAEPDPLWELLISLNRLRRRDAGVVYGSWMRDTLPRVPATTRLLTALAPPVGYSVDFLTPAVGSGGVEGRIEALRATPLLRSTRIYGSSADATPPGGFRRGAANWWPARRRRSVGWPTPRPTTSAPSSHRTGTVYGPK
ncbi:hypothetical protein OG241_18735 [Streptomyces sp. NBC_01390]|uniref:hypothetical protein n=1 Tax=Streptomyces sp. NBC_01390 TaxID=2903850 RepID=UPI003249FC34